MTGKKQDGLQAASPRPRMAWLRRIILAVSCLSLLFVSSCQTLSDFAGLSADLPIKLDASTAYAHVSPPTNFRPRRIACTANNMDMQLTPGDYTCDVQLKVKRLALLKPMPG